MAAAVAPPLSLASAFTGLVRHHIATPSSPLPSAAPGITWIWAANGIFKRGVSSDLDILIQIGNASAVPGLAGLLPHVRWSSWGTRIPSRLLPCLLEDARRAATGGTIARPVEKQYFLIWRDQDLRLVAPRGQDASPGHVAYTMPVRGNVLVDIHSHHQLPAFFSRIDDADDLGLSVSVVIGTIFTEPTIACRLNVFGHRQRVPIGLVFDGPGPFRDTYGGTHADAHD
jgi:PRTRC genetic system protein A